ncbi:MAG: mucoidy inhibitor MuiA family protein, partial [Chitinophagales bacterium]
MKMPIFISVLFQLSVLSAQKAIIVEVPVEKATVFLSGVQLFHSQNVPIAKGYNEIRVRGLAAGIDQNSVQASGWGEFTILDVQYTLFYPEPISQDLLPDDIQKKILLLNDSVAYLNFDLKSISYQKENISYQKQMLLSNKLLRGEGMSDSLPLLMQAVDYYREKLQELSANLLKLEMKEDNLHKRKTQLQNRIADLQNYWSQQNINQPLAPIPEIIISVLAEQATSAKVEVNYITYNAGWYATYDLRALDVSKPVELTYKANIWQNTGVNWNDVKIICSTGNPSLGNNPPAIGTWYIGYYNHYYERDYSESAPQSNVADDMGISQEINSYLNHSKPAMLSSNHTEQHQAIANTEFAVNL